MKDTEDREVMKVPLLERWRPWLPLVLAAAASFYMMVNRWGFALDDPWITFRYSQNLSRGMGLTFNPGERLEGYSNFLIVILAAVFERLRLDPFDFIRLGGLAALLIGLGILSRAEHRIASEEAAFPKPKDPIRQLFLGPPVAPGWWVWAGTVYLGLCPQAAVWAISGMETPYYLLALTIAWWCAGEAWTAPGKAAWGWALGAALAAVAAALLRIDGFVVAAACLGFVVWELIRGRRPRSFPPICVAAVLFLLIFLGYWGWRLSYFGHWLPNTAMAKTTGPLIQRIPSGISYLFDWFWKGGSFGLLAALWGCRLAVKQWPDADSIAQSIQSNSFTNSNPNPDTDSDFIRVDVQKDSRDEGESRDASMGGEGTSYWEKRDEWPSSAPRSSESAPQSSKSSSRPPSPPSPPSPSSSSSSRSSLNPSLSTGQALLRLAFWQIGLQMALIVGAGGDWMPAARFIVPVLGLIGIATGAGLRHWRRRGIPGRGFAWIAALWIAASLWRGDRSDKILQWCLGAARTESLWQPLRTVGQWLGNVAPPGAGVAASEAGIIPYYSRLPFIDMLGIVDAHIASLPGGLHQKFDAGYVLSRKPQYIVLTVTLEQSPQGGPAFGAFPSDDQMLKHPEFRNQYTPLRSWPRSLGQPREFQLILYERRPTSPIESPERG